MNNIAASTITGLFPVSISQNDPLVVHDKNDNFLFDLYDASGPAGFKEQLAGLIVLGINQAWSTLKPKTPEEQAKFFEENFSPFMRAGYNQALVDLTIWVHSVKELNVLDLYNKIQSMQATRREVNFKALTEELKQS